MLNAIVSRRQPGIDGQRFTVQRTGTHQVLGASAVNAQNIFHHGVPHQRPLLYLVGQQLVYRS